MTYTLPVKTTVIEFEDYPGLEVEMRTSPIPMGEYADAVEFLSVAGKDPLGTMRQLGEIVNRYLVSWNLEGDATAQPFELLLGIALAWVGAVGAVSLPLPRRSSGTEPSPEPSTLP